MTDSYHRFLARKTILSTLSGLRVALYFKQAFEPLVFYRLERYHFFCKINGNCFCYLFPPLAWLVIQMPVLMLWSYASCCLRLRCRCRRTPRCIGWFVVLPPDVRTCSVQTLHKTSACTSSFGEKPNQFHIMEVELFFSDQLLRLAFSHDSPCG